MLGVCGWSVCLSVPRIVVVAEFVDNEATCCSAVYLISLGEPMPNTECRMNDEGIACREYILFGSARMGEKLATIAAPDVEPRTNLIVIAATTSVYRVQVDLEQRTVEAIDMCHLQLAAGTQGAPRNVTYLVPRKREDVPVLKLILNLFLQAIGHCVITSQRRVVTKWYKPDGTSMVHARTHR